MPKREVINLVKKRLAKHPPKGYHLDVVPSASRQEDDWWYICIQPDREDIRRYDFYDILAQVERELDDEEKLNVLLVPAAAKPKRRSAGSRRNGTKTRKKARVG